MSHPTAITAPASAAPTTARPRRQVRTDIQALRALAVAAVLIYHFTPSLLPGGYVGVDIFFVVSGFVITSLMVTEVEDSGRLSFTRFYARRARRILPAATVTIIATTVAGLVLLPLNAWQGLARDGIFTAIFGQNWHLAATSVDYLAGGAPSPMQHFWSLSIEEQFYFLWPAALMGAFALVARGNVRRAATIVLVPTILITFALSALAGAQGDPSAYFTTHTRAWQLAIGALLATWWPAVNSFTGNTAGALEAGRAPARARTRGLLIIGAALIGYAVFAFDAQTAFPGVAALAPTLGTAAIIAAGARPGRLVEHGAVQWCGNVSYSLYLVHWPIVIFLPASLPGPVWVATGLGLSAVCAHLSFRYIEQGLPRRLQRSRPATLQRRTLLAGGISILIGVGAGGAAYAVTQVEVTSLEQEAEQLLSSRPQGFGVESISPERYVDILPGARGTAPSRASVRDDVPGSHSDGCVGANTDRVTPQCVYGDDEGEEVWALVGDSHMDQYLPAFEDIAADRRVKIVTFLHANCPFNAAQSEQDTEWDGPCRAANEDTHRELEDLDPDLIITSNWTAREWAGDPVQGFVDTWSQLPAPALVIADNPAMEGADQTTACVAENYPNTQVCSIPKDEALPTDHQLAAVDRARSEGTDVTLLDLTDLYCTDTECPPVIGNVMVYRDPHHVTVTYIRTMATLIDDRIEGIRSAG